MSLLFLCVCFKKFFSALRLQKYSTFSSKRLKFCFLCLDLEACKCTAQVLHMSACFGNTLCMKAICMLVLLMPVYGISCPVL